MEQAVERFVAVLLAPTLGEAGDTVLAAYDEDQNTGVAVTSFPAVPGAPSKIVHENPISGWSHLRSPLLVPTADGGQQLLISGTHSGIVSDSLNGLDTLQLQPGGSFAAPVAIAPAALAPGAGVRQRRGPGRRRTHADLEHEPVSRRLEQQHLPPSRAGSRLPRRRAVRGDDQLDARV